MGEVDEERIFDEETVTTSTVRTVSVRGRELVSVLEVTAVTVNPSTLDVAILKVDPFSKRTLGGNLIAHTQVTFGTGLPFVEDKMYIESTPATTQTNVANDRLTGLYRITYTTTGASPSFTVTHGLIGKD